MSGVCEILDVKSDATVYMPTFHRFAGDVVAAVSCTRPEEDRLQITYIPGEAVQVTYTGPFTHESMSRGMRLLGMSVSRPRVKSRSPRASPASAKTTYRILGAYQHLRIVRDAQQVAMPAYHRVARGAKVSLDVTRMSFGDVRMTYYLPEDDAQITYTGPFTHESMARGMRLLGMDASRPRKRRRGSPVVHSIR